LAILGTLRNGLGDRWHIAAGTEKKSAKICWLWHIGQSPLAHRGFHVRNMPTVDPTLRKVPQLANWMPSRSKIRRIW
jgi:hypothetical protein